MRYTDYMDRVTRLVGASLPTGPSRRDTGPGDCPPCDGIGRVDATWWTDVDGIAHPLRDPIEIDCPACSGSGWMSAEDRAYGRAEARGEI